ncbi:FliH/SctL family protein [Caloramator sp. ALD01]|uniref:FliH/SctL family protein n=1 Tax=Caloramator sp. ALD01 TaxID=1031288 RepID=UPI0004242433|nr:FliH/SctL family protein [Caloramator sp. ALD01]
MQLSYNVIKHTSVSDKITLSPPSIDKFINTNIKNKDEINIEEIVEEIKKQAEFDAKKIINEANKNALEIINNAKQNSKKILEDAKEEGYKEGLTKGYNDGYNKAILEAKGEAYKIIEEANKYLEGIYTEVNGYVKKSKNDIINLAVEIAKEVLKSELSISSEAIINCAQKALSKVKQKSNIILKTSINDYKILKLRQEELEQFIDSSSALIIVADSNLQNGDIYIETNNGIIDATVETQLKTILNKLLKE